MDDAASLASSVADLSSGTVNPHTVHVYAATYCQPRNATTEGSKPSHALYSVHTSQQNHSDRSRTVPHANVNGYISVPFLSLPFKTERLQLPFENGMVNMRMRTTRSTCPVRVLRSYTSCRK